MLFGPIVYLRTSVAEVSDFTAYISRGRCNWLRRVQKRAKRGLKSVYAMDMVLYYSRDYCVQEDRLDCASRIGTGRVAQEYYILFQR